VTPGQRLKLFYFLVRDQVVDGSNPQVFSLKGKLSPSTKLPAPKSILLCWGKTKEVILDDPESIHEAWQEFTVRCGRSFPYLRTAIALKRSGTPRK